MKLYGITGGIGMGKSMSTKLLIEWGIPVIDTDVLAYELVEPGQPALEEIRRAFGDEVIGDDGRLRRSVLAQIVFENPAQRAQLESILHPKIREAWLAGVARWRSMGLPCGAVVIPLLYETGASSHFDAVIAVGCTPATQRRRLLERDWTVDQAERRIAAQWPAQKKMDLAHHVIWTEPPVKVHAAQLRRIVNR